MRIEVAGEKKKVRTEEYHKYVWIVTEMKRYTPATVLPLKKKKRPERAFRLTDAGGKCTAIIDQFKGLLRSEGEGQEDDLRRTELVEEARRLLSCNCCPCFRQGKTLCHRIRRKRRRGGATNRRGWPAERRPRVERAASQPPGSRPYSSGATASARRCRRSWRSSRRRAGAAWVRGSRLCERPLGMTHVLQRRTFVHKHGSKTKGCQNTGNWRTGWAVRMGNVVQWFTRINPSN